MHFSKNIQWSPNEYANAAVVAHEAGVELLSRLEWMTLKPKIILDIGCGTAQHSLSLQTRYPQATVLAFDLTEAMLTGCSDRYANGGDGSLCLAAADALYLPLRDHSVDLVFANFFLPWHTEISALLKEWRRVLKPDGVLMFTALGLDTLQEWRTVLDETTMPTLIDMHDLGDMLMQEGFADPILDVNYFTTNYREISRLTQELRASGMWMPAAMENNSERFRTVPANPEDGKWPVTYEVIYAHAFVPAQSEEIAASADGTVRVPLTHLRRQLRSRPGSD